MDVDRWWKLRAGITIEVAVLLTTESPRFEVFFKPINSIQKPLMIEWE